MPPNLGGFFMVRSYYASECQTEYFDFERIEVIKRVIEACCIFFFQAEDVIGYWTVTGVQMCVFFFSSRRRHTRLVSDWSSDVCSSDLTPATTPRPSKSCGARRTNSAARLAPSGSPRLRWWRRSWRMPPRSGWRTLPKIGRASGRGRG